jgi:hypothetical protein
LVLQSSIDLIDWNGVDGKSYLSGMALQLVIRGIIKNDPVMD